MYQQTVPNSVKTSAYLLLANLVLSILDFILLGVIFGGSSSFQGIMESIMGSLMCLCIVFAPGILIQLAVIYGLFNLKKWAYIGAFIYSIIYLCAFPLGTILSGLTVYYLLKEETGDAFA